MDTPNKKTMKEYKEMLILKGIGSELEKMAYPKIGNLKSMLETIGYTIEPLHNKSQPSSVSDEAEKNQ